MLQDLWDEKEAAALESSRSELLRYRSNLLGADLRITNFGGGNTSSKFDLLDPVSGKPARVLAVKGSGGDLRSIGTSGFAVLYMDKLEQLIDRYRGEAHEDEMVGYYPLCAFGDNRVAASIDTTLHAFLPFDHVDHLHPDWAIALAASANGEKKIEEFNRKYGRQIIWVPWQRPGFELALMLRRAVEAAPDADGLILGSHGLFTWGRTQRECYLNSLRTIEQMGEFILDHQQRAGRPLFGGVAVGQPATIDREADGGGDPAVSARRGVVEPARRSATSTVATKRWRSPTRNGPDDLCQMGTSCPDHFLRTRISPMFVAWDPASENLDTLKAKHHGARRAVPPRLCRRTTQAFADPASPAQRGSDPSVVRDLRASGCSGSRRTSGKRGSRPSSSSTRFT